MVATDSPPAATARSTQLSVNCARASAQLVATTGLRMNFAALNPSTGASFQAPPTAVSHPPMPPTATPTTKGGPLTELCTAATRHAAAARHSSTPAPTTYRTVLDST